MGYPFDEEAMEYCLSFDCSTSSSVIIPTKWTGAGSDITLSGGNLVATSISETGNAFCSSSTSYSSGKKYLEIHYTGSAISSLTWYGAIVGNTAAYPNGYVIAQNTAWFVNNVNSGNMSTPSSGQYAAFAVDFDNSKIYGRSDADTNWNNNNTIDPNSNNGVSFAAAVTYGPLFNFYVNLSDNTGQVATVNFGTVPGGISSSNGTWHFTPPSGYTNW